MSPILGICASQNYSRSFFESIATTTVGAGGSSTITFSSIPSTYTHLQVRYLARTNTGFVNDFISFRLNSDTASNYSEHGLYGDGSAVTAGATANTTAMFGGEITGANATASIFGAGIIDLLDYADTNKYKTTRILGGDDRNGAGEIRLQSNAWRSTSAVTTLTITSYRSANFVQYSSFALYGIKTA